MQRKLLQLFQFKKGKDAAGKLNYFAPVNPALSDHCSLPELPSDPEWSPTRQNQDSHLPPGDKNNY